MRIAVVDGDGTVLKETRSVEDLGGVNAEQVQSGGGKIEKRLKSETKKGIIAWDFGDLPKQKEISRGNDGFTLFGYPALVPADDSVELHYLADPEEAKAKHRRGVAALMKLELKKDFDWLEKDLKFPKPLKLLASPYGGENGLKKQLINIVEEYVLRIPAEPPFSFNAYVDLREDRLKKLKRAAMEILDVLEKSLLLERDNREMLKRFMIKNNTKGYRQLGEDLKAEMVSYMEQVTDGWCPYSILFNFDRYMKAFACRIEKAFLSTAQYRKQEERLLPYIDKMVELSEKYEDFTCKQQEHILEYMELVEEFSVMLFAHPKMKPLQPVSEKRIDKIIELIEDKRR